MKLKKIRVRLKDIHHGKILYVAHPAIGIEQVQIVGKPRIVMLGKILGLKGRPALFVDTIPLDCDGWDRSNFVDTRSLCDMGVYKPYGYRRSFHTYKQAEQYIARVKNSPDFLKYWAKHLRGCEDAYDVMYD